jgi:hypothetical protein
VTRRILITVTGVGALAALVAAATAIASRVVTDWKGAESLAPTGLVPNVQRCGPPPANLEGRFAGSGIDTAAGTFTVTASGCVNTDTLRVTDLEATDTYLNGDGTVRITPEDFALALDRETCVASSARPVAFRVAGGTGALAGATGGGHFQIALNWTPCNGRALPAHVWFDGQLHVPR